MDGVEQERYFNWLRLGISSERLSPYRGRKSSSELFALYAWNISLSESLYPCLNSIEIALRNSIHDTASAYLGNDYWFLNHLVGREKAIASRLKQDLQKRGKTSTAGDFVSNLWFGFWVNLLSNRYEGVLWPHLLRSVFPGTPRRLLTISNMRARLNSIRHLRNRVFHHEPIWHLPDLNGQHESILETIGWISPVMCEMTRMLDRFSSVYTRGSQYYATELDSLAQSWSALRTKQD